MGNKLLTENSKFLATVHGAASMRLAQCCQHTILHHPSTQLCYCHSISLAQQLPLLLATISMILRAFFFYNDESGIYILGEETKSFC